MRDSSLRMPSHARTLGRAQQQSDGRLFYDSTVTFIFVAATSLSGSCVTPAKRPAEHR
jgi:hypothetical protein